MYALGFEEIVDLDAKNIVLASSENAKAWAEDLSKILGHCSMLLFDILIHIGPHDMSLFKLFVVVFGKFVFVA